MSKSEASPEIQWLSEPEDHDYPAAASYLSLTHTSAQVDLFISGLHRSPMTTFKAKDIFRASGLSLLGVSNSHVKKNVKKIQKGIVLSPLLLFRSGKGLVIADGYHRLCAVYLYDEDANIPCKIF